jgi:ribosomal protein L16 Arg81 hydroxylase
MQIKNFVVVALRVQSVSLSASMAFVDAPNVMMSVGHKSKNVCQEAPVDRARDNDPAQRGDGLPKASISKITDTFNEKIDRRRTNEAVKSQLKKYDTKSKLHHRLGPSNSKTQLGESAHAAAHSQGGSEAGKFKILQYSFYELC